MKYYLVTAYRAFKDGKKATRPKTLKYVYGATDDFSKAIDEDLIEAQYYSFRHPDALPFKGEEADVRIRAAIARLKMWAVPEIVITGIKPYTMEQTIVAQEGKGLRKVKDEVL